MRRQLRRQAVLLVDLAFVACATALALVLRDNLDVSAQRLVDLVPYLATSVLMAAIILSISGLTRSMWRFSGMADYLRLTICVVLIVLTSVAIGFLAYRLDGVARALPVIQGLLMAFLLIGARVATRLNHVRRQERPTRPRSSVAAAEETILVVGLNVITELFLRSVAEFSAGGIKIAGILGRTARHSGRRLSQHRILGLPEDIEHVLRMLEVHGVTVHRIVITMAFADLSPIAQHALLDIEKKSDIRLDFFAERIGLDARSSPAAYEPSSADNAPERLVVSDLEMQALSRRPYFQTKRVIDVTAAAFFAIVAMPVILLVAIVVSIDVGLPIIFWQQRPGIGGRPFKLYKFRTMRGAHDRNGVRIPDDQRLSAVGSFLRRSRLDELPQLFNIVSGDMSFVGPRPLLPVDQSAEFAARLLVRPGLTGWAQVMGGRDISVNDKAALDIWYVRNASLWLDLKVIVRTVPTIVRGEELDAGALRQAWKGLDPEVAGRSGELAVPITLVSGIGPSQHAA